MPEIRRTKGARRGPKGVSNALAEALAKVEALADVRPNDDPEKVKRWERSWKSPLTDDTGVVRSPDLPTSACGIDREHREAVRRYLESWVIPNLRDALDALNGEKIDYNSTVLDRPLY